MQRRHGIVPALVALLGLVAVAGARAQTPPVHAEESGRTLRVACVGNSITYGYGIEDRAANSYPARLQALLGQGYEVRNFGHSGARVMRSSPKAYTSMPEYREALAYEPDVVVVMLGINDATPGDWVHKERFSADLKALVESFRDDAGERPVRIWIGSIMPLFPWHRIYEEIEPNVREVRRKVEEVAAAAGVTLIDLYTPLVGEGRYYPDSLHPTKEGAAIIARAVYGAVTGDHGGLSLPFAFGDHMVLQRGQPIPVWGRADTGDTVTVVLAGVTRSAVADGNGRWRVDLPPMPAGGPHLLRVAADTVLSYRDVMVGEVWLAAGQSNLAFPLARDRDAREALPRAGLPGVRLLARAGRPEPAGRPFSRDELARITADDYFRGEWQRSSPETAADFSAVAYYFAREIHEATGVTVGVISAAVGGAPMEAFLSPEALARDPALRTLPVDWLHNPRVAEWPRERAATNLAEWAEGPREAPMPHHPFEPGFLHHAAIEPLIPYGIRGVIWYQGESNATLSDGRVPAGDSLNRALLAGLIRDWRAGWGEADLPFYYVQLPNLNRNWMEFRQLQLDLLDDLPGLGMAVTIDLGDSTDVHPRAKREVARRLALWARSHEYGESRLVFSGPLPEGVGREGAAVRVEFEHLGGGLAALDGAPLRGFEVAGADGVWHPPSAAIDRNTVLVRSADVLEPGAVRYDWAGNPDGNLGNAAGLPASPFRARLSGRARDRH